MGQVNRTTIVPFTSDQMFALVNDVEAYPGFLPWCSAAEVEGIGEDHLIATLTLSVGRLRQSVTTRNTLQPGRRIDMELVRGPLRKLCGAWRFEDLAGKHCRVSLDLDFEFNNRVLKLALDKVFGQLTYSSVDAFRNRARQIYGED